MADRLDDLLRTIRDAPTEEAALAAFQAAPPEVRAAYTSLTPEAVQSRLAAQPPAEPSLGTRLGMTAARVVPGVAGTVAGGLLGGPLGAAAGGALGSSAGEGLAEWLGGEDFNPAQIAVQGALGAIPLKGGSVAQFVKQGALLGGGGQAATNVAAGDPVLSNVPTAAGLGALFGGGAGKLASLRRGATPAPPPPRTTAAIGGALREGAVEQGPTGSGQLAHLGASLAETPPPPTPVVPRMTRTGADVPADIPPAAFADLFTRGQVTATVPKPRTMADLGEALNTALRADQPVLPPAAPSHYTPAVESGTGGFKATVNVKSPVKAPQTAPVAPGAAIGEAGVSTVAPAAVVAPEAAEALSRGPVVEPGAKVLPGPERAPDGSLVVPPGLVEVYDRLRAQGVDSFVAQRVVRNRGVLPLEARDAVVAGKSKLRAALAGKELDAATESAFDLMGQEYRAQQAVGAEAGARSVGAMLAGMQRATKKELGIPSTPKGKAPKGQAGAISPQALFMLGKGAAGGVAGATYGGQIDDEDPVRGALRYGALGAAAGMSVGSVRGMNNVLIANYLGQPRTQMRNILSTAVHMLGQPLIETPAAVAAQALFRRPTSVTLGEVGPQLTALWGGLTSGWQEFMTSFRTGELSPELAKALKAGRDTSTELTDLKQWELPGGLANPQNLASRMLSAFDAWMFRAAKLESAAGLAYTAAKQEGLQGDALWGRVAQLQANPTPELDALANEAGRRITFKSDPSWLANQVIKMREERPALALLIPFVRTIDSILQRGIELTPLGMARRAYRTATGTPLPAGPEGAKTLGRELLGMASVLPLLSLHAAGRLTGRGPEPSNESAREQWRAERKTPYSVKLPLPESLATNLGFEVSPVGEYWVPYLWLGPSAVPMSTISSAIEAWQEGAQAEKDDSELVARAAAAAGTALLNQHYLQDVFTLGSVITDYNEGTRLIRKLAAGFVPGSGFLRGYAQSDDPIVRNAQSFADELRLLFADTADQVPPLIKADGTPVTRPLGSGPLSMLSPVTPSPSTPNPLAALFEGTDTKYPGRPDATFSVGGVTIPQTPAQKAELQAARGQGKFDLLRANADRLATLPPEARGRQLRSVLSRGSERGTRTIQQQRAEEIRTARTTARREIRALLNPE